MRARQAPGLLSSVRVPLLFLVLAVSGLVLAAAGTAGPSVRRAELDSRSFTVMTFNLHHGIDGTSRYNLQRAIDVIARVGPDLVGLQEVTRNHPFYECDDQPARLAAGLQRATGRPWYQVYMKEWSVRKDLACMQHGRGDGPNTEGLVLLAPEPIESVSSVKLFNSRLALAGRVRSAGRVVFVTTHLSHGASRADDRARQVQEILSWAGRERSPVVLMGDMNAAANSPELTPVHARYRDAWKAAAAAGASRGVPGGATLARGSGRVDYIFHAPALRLEWAESVDTSALLGLHASDHHPVVASFLLP